MLSTEERKAKERKLDAAAVNWKNASDEDSRVYKNEIWLQVFKLYAPEYLIDNWEKPVDDPKYDPNALIDALEEAFAKYTPEAGQFSHYFSKLFSGRKKDAYRYEQRHAPRGDSLERPVTEDENETLGDVLPSDERFEPESTVRIDSLLADLTSMILNFSRKKGKSNNPTRKMWYHLFYTEDMTQVMKEHMIRFAHERDIFSAMDLEYLDYYMSVPCRTGKAVMNTPLKPYCQVVPSQTDLSPVPVPIPGDVSLCYLKLCRGISAGASARSNQLGFYKTEKENLLSC